MIVQAVTLLGKRRAVRHHCLVGGRQSPEGHHIYRFHTKDLNPFAFAGLWEFARISGEEILSATIIVGAPNPLAAAIHDRMPVILDPSDYDRWLEKDVPVEELRALLRPYPAERMTAEAVSRRVNSVKNDDEACLAPIGEPPLTA